VRRLPPLSFFFLSFDCVSSLRGRKNKGRRERKKERKTEEKERKRRKSPHSKAFNP
jgi:hypothetical protein